MLMVAAKEPRSVSMSLFGDDPHIEVKRAVAANPNATSDHLEHLVNHRNRSVRSAAALHKNLTKPQLVSLAKDPEHSVRLSVAKNPNVTEDILDILHQGWLSDNLKNFLPD